MKSSKVVDTDGETFPDPLSLNYKSLLENNYFKTPFLQVDVDESFIKTPYILIYTYYNRYNMGRDSAGRVYLDDIILDLNNIKHKDSLVDGDTVYFPDPTELKSLISTLYEKEL